MRPPLSLSTATGTLIGLLALTACGSTGQTDQAASSDELQVVASFYPLEFVVSRVAEDLANIDMLTAPGIDPHDVELSPRAVGTVKQADLVVYSAGLQTAVDDAVAEQAEDHALDVSEAADLIDTGAGDEHADHAHEDEDHADEHEDEGHDEEHSDEEHEEEDNEKSPGNVDPHFWLNPERMMSVTTAVSEQLSAVDPEHATTYAENASMLIAELENVQQDYDTGLANCEQRDLVTSHAAFGYVAMAHDFHLIGIAGISPESEPSPARLAEVAEIVDEAGVDTIYSEVLLGSEIAETVAAETGADVLVLDPLEGITEDSPGQDYLAVMEANLTSLRTGQSCRS